MAEIKYPSGNPVKLLVDLQGFQDGRLIIFEIWRKTELEDKRIAEVYGVVKGGKGIGEWIPEFESKEEILVLTEHTNEQVESTKYYFKTKINDLELASDDIVFTYTLEIFLVNENKEPIDGVGFTITFADDSKKKGVLKKGSVRIEDAPPGGYKLELEGGYEFIFK
jgi:hypothetical protein